MAKENSSLPVRTPVFSLRIGEIAKLDINFDGCVGIVVIAAIGTICTVCGGSAAIPQIVEAIHKAVAK